ncbi:discoidin domain-containing protein [Chitinophagaceae bacterium 26-R-25]|nr:discoidin domain-containing protein [Chitinophagaceae bacterium 26-R-25]
MHLPIKRYSAEPGHSNWFTFLLRLSLMITLSVVIPHAYAIAGTQATYYVDPINGNDTTNSGTSIGSAFKTIYKARDVVRTINSNMTGDIYIYLRGGTYQLDSTLTLTDSDGGTNGYNIIYAAYYGEKAIISGGKQITNWSLCDSCLNIYSAYAGNIETRQLFVNGVRAIRARSTGSPSPMGFVQAIGYTSSASVFANNAKPMDQWNNKRDIEFVFISQWTAPRVGVDSITYDGTTTTIKMKQPAWGSATNKGYSSVGANSSKYPAWIENAYELLDAEGEWYLNRATDTIYYKPKSGEDLSTATVIAPLLDELVRVQGSDLDHKAHNLQFIGITFNYTTDTKANSDSGHVDSQNDIMSYLLSAAFNLKYANAIQFDHDVFEHLGNTGLNMYAGCQDNLVIGSRFADLSGKGLQVGDYNGAGVSGSENYGGSTDSRALLRNNDVINNYFNKIGTEYYSSAAIGATFPQDMDVVHNEIGNVPYSGMHIGYYSGYAHKNTHILYNYVHEATTVCEDGGEIYVIGETGGDSLNMGLISNNYVQNQYKQTGALYLDNGSNWWNVLDNVVNNAPRFFMTNGPSHDSVANTYTTTGAYINKGTPVTGTVVVSNGAWPPAAQLIIDSAGLQKPYLDIKPSTTPSTSRLFEIFDWRRVNETPQDWTINNAGGDGTVTVQGVPTPTNKSMGLSKTGTASGQDLVSSHGFTALYAGTVEVQAKAGQTNAVVLPIALKSGSTNLIQIAFNSDGQIAYKNAAAAWVDIQSYAAGTWYKFKVEFDVVTSTYNLYIDTTKVLTNQAFATSGSAADTLSQIIKSSSVGTINVDSINVYEGYMARPNVSVHKVITGYSSQYNATSWKAANINDGVVNTSSYAWASASGSSTSNQWVSMDLGQSYTLSSFIIQGEGYENNRNVKDYILYGSFTGAFAGEEFVISSGTIPSLSIYQTQSVYFTPMDARYIMFKATSSYSNLVTVGELSLFGEVAATQPTITNVSLNKTIMGYSSQYDANAWKAANINDGVVNTSSYGWASANGAGTSNQWVSMDLGQSYTVSSFVIQGEGYQNNRNVKDYILYGSFTGAFAGEEFVISSGTIPSLSTYQKYTVSFTAMDTRFIKFKATSSYSNLVTVGELSLYGQLAASQPPPAPTLVPSNKPIIGFSSQYNTSTYKAANINDGVVNSSYNGWASASGSGTRNEWVSIDLGQTYTLSSFIIQNEYGANGRNVKDYVLYGSATGSFTGEEYVISSGTLPSLNALASDTVSFTSVDARYIKFKGTSSYSSFVIIGELRFLGVLAATQPPTNNVSVNKTVTGYSSQFNGAYSAANINDGSVAEWISASGTVTNEWVKMDLGQTYTLSSFTIQNESGAAGRNVKDYVLYGSATGVFGGEEFVISSGTIPSQLSGESYSANFSAIDARYVKLKAASGYTSFVVVGELSLFGTASANGAGYWPLDDSTGTVASDESGNGKTGTLNGAASWATGDYYGVSFNGTNGYVNIPDVANPVGTTISLWVKPNASTAQNIWVRTNASGPTSYWSHQLRINSSGKFEAYMFDGASKSVSGTTTVQPGTWYFITLVASTGGALSLYVNGALEGTPVSIGTMWSAGTRYCLGSNSGGGFGWYNGIANEITLFDRVLDASEISDMYNSH